MTNYSFFFGGKDAFEYSGFYVSAPGDFDRDGRDDLLIGAPDAPGQFTPQAGFTYLFTADLLDIADRADSIDNTADGVIDFLNFPLDALNVAGSAGAYAFAPEEGRLGYQISFIESNGQVTGIGIHSRDGDGQPAANTEKYLGTESFQNADARDNAQDGIIQANGIHSFSAGLRPSPDPQLSAIDLVATSDSGSSQTDNITNDTTPTIAFTAEQGTFVQIHWGDGSGSVVTLVGTGAEQQVTLGKAYDSDGDKTVTIRAINDTGYLTTQTLKISVDTTTTSVDTTAPELSAIDLVENADSGTSQEDDLTNDTTPTISFTAEKGSTVEIDWGDGKGPVAVDNGTGEVQTYTLDAEYTSDGSKTITVVAEDAAENKTTQTLKVTLDTDPPELSAIDLDADSDTGELNADDLTSDTTPTITFTAEEGTTVEIDWDDGNGLVNLGEATGEAQTITLQKGYASDGEKGITVVATDAAGNKSTETLNVEIDTKAPGTGGTSYTFVGEDEKDRSGASVSSAGDVDGDGKDDLLIGAVYAGGDSEGKTYLVAAADLANADAADGQTDGIINLGNIAAQAGSYEFLGVSENDGTGRSVSSAGDVDGDELADLLISAPEADNGDHNHGKTYLITAADLAKADAADETVDGIIDLANIGLGEGSQLTGSYVFVGEGAEQYATDNVTSLGDIDGDLKDDFLISAPRAQNNAGQTFLVSSRDLVLADAADEVVDGVINLANIAAQQHSYSLIGGENGLSGASVSSAGDVDKDGKEDLLIGAYRGAGDKGLTYLLTAEGLANLDGDDDGVIDLNNIAGQPGAYVFAGEDTSDTIGYSVSSAGDVDGDGFDDVLIGAPFAELLNANTGNFADAVNGQGLTYLVSGADLANAEKVDGIIDLGKISGQPGSYVFVGPDEFHYSGRSVSSAGDVDGDGLDDLLIGADGAVPSGPVSFDGKGQTFLVMGADLKAADGADGTNDGIIDLGNIAGLPGSYVFTGEDLGDFSGSRVSSAGDVDGDGKADLLLGAADAEGGPNEASAQGLTYLITAAELKEMDAADGNADGNIDLANVSQKPVETAVTSIAGGNGVISNNGYTNDNTLTFNGTSETESLVYLYLNTLRVGPIEVGQNGNWSFDYTKKGLADGVYTVTADAKDFAGNTTEKSEAITLTIDTKAPTDIALEGDTVAENSAAETKIGTITLTESSPFKLSLKDDADGRFELKEGVLFVANSDATLDFETAASHEIIVVASDAAGNAASQTLTINVTDVAEGGSSGGSSGGGTGSATDPVQTNPDSLVLNGSGNNDTLLGEGLNDTLRGDGGDDLIVGNTGVDLLLGHAGNDTIQGGEDADAIWAGADNDSVEGGTGNDTIGGGTGADTLYGGDGNDVLFGNDGADAAYGGGQDDVIWAGEDQDTLGGGGGNDQVGAGDGDDQIFGGAGNDIAYGSSGNDQIFGGADSDTLYGGADNDTLFGGSGDDEMFGGSGNDNFVFESGHGNDGIYGFASNGDNTLDLSALGLSDASDLSFLQQGDDLVIDTGSGTITLYDTTQDDLGAGDILF